MTTEMILDACLDAALKSLDKTLIDDHDIRSRIEYVCRCTSNKAGVRLLMSCLLAKIDDPKLNPCKPYTEIGDDDSFSGRSYDEKFITDFIRKNDLPLNITTAFLTPALRNINRPLSPANEFVGRPRDLYVKASELLTYVVETRISPDLLLTELIRQMVVIRNEDNSRLENQLSKLSQPEGTLDLSSEAILKIIRMHLECDHSSRLPVLVVAAAYHAAGEYLRERVLPLQRHNAADSQTNSLGDVEICLISDDSVVTVFEMKDRQVTKSDIDCVVEKILRSGGEIDNYLIITTKKVEPAISEYASRLYTQTEGTEIAILDCISFLRHFLHLFHRIRVVYLDCYQRLMLSEPVSSVSASLKEAFLALRINAQNSTSS